MLVALGRKQAWLFIVIVCLLQACGSQPTFKQGIVKRVWGGHRHCTTGLVLLSCVLFGQRPSHLKALLLSPNLSLSSLKRLNRVPRKLVSTALMPPKSNKKKSVAKAAPTSGGSSSGAAAGDPPPQDPPPNEPQGDQLRSITLDDGTTIDLTKEHVDMGYSLDE